MENLTTENAVVYKTNSIPACKTAEKDEKLRKIGQTRRRFIQRYKKINVPNRISNTKWKRTLRKSLKCSRLPSRIKRKESDETKPFRYFTVVVTKWNEESQPQPPTTENRFPSEEKEKKKKWENTFFFWRIAENENQAIERFLSLWRKTRRS